MDEKKTEYFFLKFLEHEIGLFPFFGEGGDGFFFQFIHADGDAVEGDGDDDWDFLFIPKDKTDFEGGSGGKFFQEIGFGVECGDTSFGSAALHTHFELFPLIHSHEDAGIEENIDRGMDDEGGFAVFTELTKDHLDDIFSGIGRGDHLRKAAAGFIDADGGTGEAPGTKLIADGQFGPGGCGEAQGQSEEQRGDFIRFHGGASVSDLPNFLKNK